MFVVVADTEGACEGDVGELVEVQFSAAPPHDDESSFVADGGGEEFELSVVAPPEGDLPRSPPVRSLAVAGVVDVAPGAVGVEGEAKSSLDAEEPPPPLPPFDITPAVFPPFGVAHGDDGPFVVGTFESSITDTPPPPPPPPPLPFASITDADAVVAEEEEEAVEPPPAAPVVVAVVTDDGGLFNSISIVVSGPVPREHW